METKASSSVGTSAPNLQQSDLKEAMPNSKSTNKTQPELDEEDDDEDLEDLEDLEDEDDGEGWISWFCSLEGHEFFAEVEEEYIQDTFNIVGIKPYINNFEAALEMILGPAPEEEDVLEQAFVDLYRDAMDLYGLIHSRYIISPRGLAQMREKYADDIFGHCPRVLCDKQEMIPVGMASDLRVYRLRMFCPLCQEVYEVQNEHDVTKDIDGAYFGPSFPHIFLQTFCVWKSGRPPIPYQPRLFGYIIHQRKSIIEIKMANGEYGSAYKSVNVNALQNTGHVESIE